MSEPGGFVLIPPGGGAQHWQPQPANGWIEVLTSPRIAGMPAGFSAGLQELPPLGKIREHAHPAQTEIFWVVAGEALGRVDGVVRRIPTGSFMVAPPHSRHQKRRSIVCTSHQTAQQRHRLVRYRCGCEWR